MRRAGKGKGGFNLPPIRNPLKQGKRQKAGFHSTPSRKKGKSHAASSVTDSIHGVFRRISDKVQRKYTISLPEPSEGLKAVTKTLGLGEKQIIKLYRNFQRIDFDETGLISRVEFFEALGEEETHLTRSLFRLIEINDDASISFDDFVRICSTWCLYSKNDILKFCFESFDEDASGFIDENEFKVLCTAVNKGSPMFPGNFDAALQMVDDNGDGVIDFNEFRVLDKRFPLMLFPIFRLQEKMQRITLGERNWVEINQRVERGRTRRLYSNENSKGIARHKSRSNQFRNKITKLPPICLDPDRIDALKRGKFMNDL